MGVVLGEAPTVKCVPQSLSCACRDRPHRLPVLARNALVVSFAALVAYSFEVTGYQPFILTGETAKGLPPVRAPPFSWTTANGTVSFSEMVQVSTGSRRCGGSGGPGPFPVSLTRLLSGEGLSP